MTGGRAVAYGANLIVESPALTDGAFRVGVVLGVLANLAVYLYVWLVVPGLPRLIPLHYNGAGVVDQIGRPEDLFKLPAIASLLLVVNTLIAIVVHWRERPAAHILVWTALATQVIFGTGAWVLVGRAAGE